MPAGQPGATEYLIIARREHGGSPVLARHDHHATGRAEPLARN
jgi:hypothetical protein